MNFFGLNFSLSTEGLWLGSESSLRQIITLVEDVRAADPRLFLEGRQGQGEPGVDEIGERLITRHGDSAVVSIKGTLVNAYSCLEEMMPGSMTSYDSIRAAVVKLAGEKDIKRVVFDIGSPGGMASGVQLAGRAIQQLSKRKEVSAHTETMAASAGYWLASSAPRVTASEMAEVGSIGVVATVTDVTKKLEAEGIKVHVIKAGKYKGIGVPGKEITDADIEYVQGRIDKLNNFFLSHVAKGRHLKLSDRAKWADAQLFYAGEAKAVGLIDAIADLSDVIGGTSATHQSRGKNMNITEEKLAMISAGASPEAVLTSEELAEYAEAATAAEAQAEAIAAVEAPVADPATAEPAAEAASAPAAVTNVSVNAELAKDLGRAEAKLEAANVQIEKLTADLAAATASVGALKGVAQAAVTNLQVALRQPREVKEDPAAIAEQFASLKQLMANRMPVGRQSDASVATKALDVKPSARVPNPVRPQ